MARRLAILEQKATPEEVEAYRRFVVAVAEAAAKAHKEGGFIGIGGKEVSESEQAALDEIRGNPRGGGRWTRLTPSTSATTGATSRRR